MHWDSVLSSVFEHGLVMLAAIFQCLIFRTLTKVESPRLDDRAVLAVGFEEATESDHIVDRVDILLDVHLTDLHGFEVLERLQGDSRTIDIPVVVLSADATTWQRRRFRNAGVYEYLSKPLDLQQLLDVIDQHLGAGAVSRVIADIRERITTS